MAYTTKWDEFHKFVDKRSTASGNLTAGTTAATTYWSPVQTIVSLWQDRTGERVPDWKGKIQRGELAASPFSTNRSKLIDVKSVSCSARRQEPGTPAYWTTQSFSGVYSMPATVWEAVPVSVGNEALSTVLDRIRAQVEHTSVLPALAEMRSTIRMFGAPGSAIVDLTNRRLNRLELEARNLKGTTVFRRIKWEKIVASTYLEYAFGLVPLMEDTKAIAESLARWKAEKEEDLPRPTREFITSKADKLTSDTVTTTGTDSPLEQLRWTKTVTTNREFGVRYKVRLKHSLQADFGSNERLQQLLGFQPLNWIPAAYEVVPWSWLLDYFLNVQQIIDAGVTDTSHVDWIIRTSRAKITRRTYTHWTLREGFTQVWALPPSGPCGGTTVSTAFSRSLPTSLGLPIPVLSYPTSVKKLANMTAALFSRRVKSSALWLGIGHH